MHVHGNAKAERVRILNIPHAKVAAMPLYNSMYARAGDDPNGVVPWPLRLAVTACLKALEGNVSPVLGIRHAQSY